ncbi:MAG: hypothetical protein IPO92_15640 [Saprospiraceae bacterium]|nr:hypothetical protein [Saprospiraceae bacterium]
MKHILKIFVFVLFGFTAYSQDDMASDSTGLPGDQFSLQGALELFKNAESPETFEKSLNTEENHVNNLDLNGDDDIDYIKVLSKKDGDVHIFVLQVAVSENENQDVAVLELEKTGNDVAMLQIVGDEDLYGEEVIIEYGDGDDEEMDEDSNKKGPGVYYPNRPYVTVNVWGWPCVRFVYAPAYRPWISPWRWRSYPTWWRPWRPFGWAVWHPFRTRHYRPGLHIVHRHRAVRAHNIYRPGRVTSVSVRSRHAGAHANYKVTRTKTKVTGPRGNSVTKKTTTVKGPRGNVRGQKTTIKKSRRN